MQICLLSCLRRHMSHRSNRMCNERNSSVSYQTSSAINQHSAALCRRRLRLLAGRADIDRPYRRHTADRRYRRRAWNPRQLARADSAHRDAPNRNRTVCCSGALSDQYGLLEHREERAGRPEKATAALQAATSRVERQALESFLKNPPVLSPLALSGLAALGIPPPDRRHRIVEVEALRLHEANARRIQAC